MTASGSKPSGRLTLGKAVIRCDNGTLFPVVDILVIFIRVKLSRQLQSKVLPKSRDDVWLKCEEVENFNEKKTPSILFIGFRSLRKSPQKWKESGFEIEKYLGEINQAKTPGHQEFASNRILNWWATALLD